MGDANLCQIYSVIVFTMHLFWKGHRRALEALLHISEFCKAIATGDARL